MKKPRMGGAGLLGFHYGGNLQWVGGTHHYQKHNTQWHPGWVNFSSRDELTVGHDLRGDVWSQLYWET